MKMMMQHTKVFFKVIFLFTISIIFTSCFENETILIDENEENNLRMDDELTSLMKSVSSHNAYYDDFIDDCYCFSINYPYQIKISEELHTINSDEDLYQFSNTPNEEIELVFPVSVSLTNFENHTIKVKSEYEELKAQCEAGLLYDEHIDCAEFVYPMRIAGYNAQSRRFELNTFNHDQDLFTYLARLDNNSLYRIVYPTNIFMFHQEYFNIESNFGLETHFKIAHNTCGIRED